VPSRPHAAIASPQRRGALHTAQTGAWGGTCERHGTGSQQGRSVPCAEGGARAAGDAAAWSSKSSCSCLSGMNGNAAEPSIAAAEGGQDESSAFAQVRLCTPPWRQAMVLRWRVVGMVVCALHSVVHAQTGGDASCPCITPTDANYPPTPINGTGASCRPFATLLSQKVDDGYELLPLRSTCRRVPTTKQGTTQPCVGRHDHSIRVAPLTRPPLAPISRSDADAS
jgi:hypothetical protein